MKVCGVWVHTDCEPTARQGWRKTQTLCILCILCIYWASQTNNIFYAWRQRQQHQQQKGASPAGGGGTIYVGDLSNYNQQRFKTGWKRVAATRGDTLTCCQTGLERGALLGAFRVLVLAVVVALGTIVRILSAPSAGFPAAEMSACGFSPRFIFWHPRCCARDEMLTLSSGGRSPARASIFSFLFKCFKIRRGRPLVVRAVRLRGNLWKKHGEGYKFLKGHSIALVISL